MAQFDIHRLEGGLLVIDLQTDLIGLEVTRLVAPLRRAGGAIVFKGLTPVIAFAETDYVVALHEMAAVPAAQLGPPIGSAREARDALMRGIDILITGF